MEEGILFVVTLWDDDHQLVYAVVAKDQGEAEEIALNLHRDSFEEVGKLEIDNELTFDITAASDINGRIYNVKLIRS